MTHKPSPKAMTEFFARNTGIARIGTWDQLQKKLKEHGQGVELTPAYAMNLIVDDLLTHAYVFVDVLPEEGKEGIFYITPDGMVSTWDEGEYKIVGFSHIDQELDENSDNPIANKVVAKELKETNEKLEETNEKVDTKFKEIDEKFEEVDGRLGGIDDSLETVNDRLDGIDDRLEEDKARLDSQETRIENNEAKLATIVNSGSKVFRTVATLTFTVDGYTKLTLDQIQGANKEDIVIDTTLIVDPVGTLGVVTAYSETRALYNVRTLNTSFTGRQGVRIGTVEKKENLPKTVAEAEAYGWQTPVVGDFAYVRQDEDHGNKLSEWIITEISDKKEIDWSYSHIINQGDYQEQSKGIDAGKILTAGPVDGTFGEPIDPETLGGRADWNENDSESKDFIKNRTHYVNDEGEYVKLDSQFIKIGETLRIDEDGNIQTEEEITAEEVQSTWEKILKPEPEEPDVQSS